MSTGRPEEWIVVTEDAKTLPVIEVLTGRGFVTGKSGSGKSILGGTPVLTETGWRPIEAVSVGDRVWSLDTTTGQPVCRPVRDTISHEDDRLLRITLADGTTVIGTADHSFLTRTAGGIRSIRGKDLQVGTQMPVMGEGLESRGEPSVPRSRTDGGVTTDDDGPVPVPSTITWEPVTAIEPFPGTHTVYDLDVVGTDTFLANGVYVHNSNTAGVIAEELLAANFNLLVIDVEGEYYGLKEEFQVLHAGADDRCDVQVGPADAERLADIALNENMPTIVDVSGFATLDESKALIQGVLESLYQQERSAEKPFLVIVEEIQEYLPQSGGKDDLAKLLIRIAKRGRKRGLGITGISQRPSSVDKDFITQCDWMVWHRLTWKNDIGVVRDILGDDVAEEVTELGDGEGYLMTDWDESVERVQFKRKRTFDAGATPGLQEFDRPDLVEVSNDLLADLGGLDDSTPEEPEPTSPATEDAEAPEASAEPREGPTVELAPETEAELESLDRDALLEEAKSARRRNRILQDEVDELRSILDTVEGRSTPDAPYAGDGSAEDTGVEAPTIRRPSVPRRPASGGVAGVLEEFSYLVEYVLTGIGLLFIDGLRLLATLPTRLLGEPNPREPSANAPGGGNAVVVGFLGLLLLGLLGVVLYLTVLA